MLGTYSHGMQIKIPARFQDQNKNPVAMENVVVRIEHFNEAHREMQTILDDQPMNEVVTGQYLYMFQVPPHAGHGNYLVRIKAKMIGNRSDIQEATDYFLVRDDAGLTETYVDKQERSQEDYGMLEPVKNTNSQPIDPTLSEDEIFNSEKRALVEQVNQMNKEARTVHSTRNFVEDIVVSVENKPLAGIHVNVYDKPTFVPRGQNNTLVASAITGEDGRWKMALPTGEFVFVYKGIGLRENREFRKV